MQNIPENDALVRKALRRAYAAEACAGPLPDDLQGLLDAIAAQEREMRDADVPRLAAE